MADTLDDLIDHWKRDPLGTYNTWFLWEERLKNFRSIRQGIRQVITQIGRWDHFLSMREGILRLNDRHRGRLSNDLGAIGGLMFDIGSGRYPAPPRDNDPAALAAWRTDLDRVRAESAAAAKARQAEQEGDATHTEIQGWLRDLGLPRRAQG